jgi:hypothetical protein
MLKTLSILAMLLTALAALAPPASAASAASPRDERLAASDAFFTNAAPPRFQIEITGADLDKLKKDNRAYV